MAENTIVEKWRPENKLDDALLSTISTDKNIEDATPAVSPTISEDGADYEVLYFSDAAAKKVKELIDEEENPNLKLRVFITGGGCSGFQYGFTFDEDVNDDDFQLQKNEVTLLVDAMSLQYLEQAEIDYKEDLNGSQFVIRNPNAATTCGCGSSFSLD